MLFILDAEEGEAVPNDLNGMKNLVQGLRKKISG